MNEQGALTAVCYDAESISIKSYTNKSIQPEQQHVTGEDDAVVSLPQSGIHDAVHQPSKDKLGHVPPEDHHHISRGSIMKGNKICASFSLSWRS